VYGDDRVIRYTGADVDTDDAEDAQATKWGLAGIKLGFLFMLSLMFLDFGNCKVLNTTMLIIVARCLNIFNFPAF